MNNTTKLVHYRRLFIRLLALLMPAAISVGSTRAQAPPPPPTGWHYQQSGVLYKAMLNSTSQLQLPYPYAGGSTLTLTIRHQDGVNTVFLSVSKGLLAPSYQGGTALVRLNGGKPVAYPLSAAANGRGNLLFFEDSQRFIRQVRTAKTMDVQLKVVGQNLNVIRFNAAGLRWNY